jgi:TBC1 domain family protein 5
LLELNQEDAQKTALKKRSNKIFNNYLREIDPDLYKHILGIDVQPEIIFLKFLRCLLSREFHISSLIYVWDFIFAGIDEKGRIYLKE